MNRFERDRQLGVSAGKGPRGPLRTMCPSRAGAGHRLTTAPLQCDAIVAGAFSLLLIATVGCGPKTGAITGKVTFQGEAITIGTIAFIGPSGTVSSATVDSGSYSVSDVEIGQATVTITSHRPSPMMHPPTGPDSGAAPSTPLKYIPIPDQYSKQNQSGLIYTVRDGPQIHDIVLD